MDFTMTYNQRNAWHYGIILSRVDRINDVPDYLIKLGGSDLIPYLLVDEKMKAFIYDAEFMMKKHPVRVVDLYYDFRPRSTDWRERDAEIAVWLDADLIDGLDDGIAVSDFVIPFGRTAQSLMTVYH